ncbi:M24 family metallopeptidase [Phreatobacter stygius]|uniref:Aminopeptidase P family protein n=1 Tax=Phreatobacter stygius TaxID=1940610 RepID=A0A4D7BG86_9HYPH|nr:Xaa-Pro peptidase family protein [Phreatobacter stygius]QCI66872.1 aminopeptidase P family protein [Phreatobacter stygius]
MSKSDFPPEEFDDRLVRVRQAMANAGLDWLLLFHPVSIHWLTGSDAKGYQAFQCLLVPAAGVAPIMFTRLSEQAEILDDALTGELVCWGGPEPEDPLAAFAILARRLGLPAARVGMEVPAFYLHPHHYLAIKALLGDALVAEPSSLVHDLKLRKSARELVLIRKAAAIADLTVEALVGALRPGHSELEVTAAIYQALLAAGGGQPVTPVNLVSGPRAGFSHGAPTERRLEPGDFGNAEYCVPYRRYSVSIGRQFAIGRPSARMLQLYDVARRASDAAIAAIRAGVPATVPHEAAKRVIAEAGLDHARVHISGYGVAPGFPPASGEPIHLFGGSPYRLEAGMVLSVCPPVFLGEERLGARLVDNVLVTETGAERLCRASRDLIVV